jgi:hypothetical protein
MTFIALSALMLVTICAVLVVHKQYEDGLIGRIALGCIGLMGLIFAITELAGYRRYSETPEILVLLLALDAFMARHLWRFLKWTRTGDFAWPTSKVKNG